MATTKPRIMVTIEIEDYAVLKRLSRLRDVPMSRIVAEFIHEVTPVLDRISDTIESAQKAEASAKSDFVRLLDEAEAQLAPLVDDARNQLDLFSGEVRAIAKRHAEADARTHRQSE